jgi:DNA mismatch repair protein MutS2
MAFAPGDRVHIASFGTGVVREARNAGRYTVEIKGRTMIVAASQLEPAAPERAARKRSGGGAAPSDEGGTRAEGRSSLDLHGKTVLEAVDALDRFLNDALLAGRREVRVIHGRSGGRVKAAIHARLRELAPVRAFRLDRANPGVTIVTF